MPSPFAVRLAAIASITVALLLAAPAAGLGTTYYVDCESGSDESTGRTEAAPWKSIEAVNRMTFLPGDHLRLKAGCVWSGTLSPRGSGVEGRPITLDRYGEGQSPLVRGEGAIAALLLTDQEFWEIANIRFTNDASTPGLRRGVLVRALTPDRVFRHIQLRRLDVRDVRGQLGADMDAKATGGIGFETRGAARASRFDDILIEDNVVEHVDSVGIYLWSEPGPHPRHPRWDGLHYTRVAVRGNRLADIGKNAIIVRATVAPVIERNTVTGAAARFHGNAIFVFGTKDAVIQFNEVSGTRFHGLEGAAFDSDYNSEGTLIQYNYSHDNGGGLANICSNPPRGFNDGTVIRYNVSRDEIDRVIAFDGPATNTEIYHNTLVIGPGRSPRIVEFDVFGKTRGYADRVTFRNNIIQNLGGGTYVWGGATGVRFEGNCFLGAHPESEPADPEKTVGEPRFRAPGEVGAGLASVAGYALEPGSACAGSTVAVPAAGGRDFFGTPLPASGSDRGAIQTKTAKRRQEER